MNEAGGAGCPPFVDITENARDGMALNGKIIKSISGFYEVYTEGAIYRCRAKGVFRALHQKPLVGDDVTIDVTDTVSVPPEGNVTALLPRRNDLIRPNVANVDQALLLFAVTNPAPSYQMLDRFLITMERKDLPAVLCFNKVDLAAQEDLEELRTVYGNCGCKVLFIQARETEALAQDAPLMSDCDGQETGTAPEDGLSVPGLGLQEDGATQQDAAVSQHDLDQLRAVLDGKTTVITGPSGAGKSTLINRLCPDARRETGELSRKIQRGKNTTRVVELLAAGDDTFLVDTPGFTSLFLQDMQAEDLKNYYPEFRPYAPQCRFQGCNHMAEPDCAVKAAAKAHAISRIRYKNYTEIYATLKDQRPLYNRKAPY